MMNQSQQSPGTTTSKGMDPKLIQRNSNGMVSRRSSNGNGSNHNHNSNQTTRKQRREQALADADKVIWDDCNNFNLCSVVISHHRKIPSMHNGSDAGYGNGNGEEVHGLATNGMMLASSLYEMYDTVVNLQEDYELGIDWDEVPLLQRDEPPAYLLNLDMSQVEAHVKRASAGNAANDFASASMNSRQLNSMLVESGQQDAWEDIVPGLFFNEEFNLTDPICFEQVLTISNCSSDGPLRENDFHQQQDILSQYLDTVESALLQQVKTRSKDFFKETKQFQNLKEMVNLGHSEVKNLREKQENLIQISSTELNPIPKESMQRDNLKQLEFTMDSVADLLDSKLAISGLIAAGDYMEAIATIIRSREVLSSSAVSDGNIDSVEICKLFSLSTVERQLLEYENLIVTDLSKRLVDLFLSWEDIDNINVENGDKLFLQQNRTTLESRRVKENEIKDLVHALESCQQLSAAGEMYYNRLGDIMKETINTTISECVHDATINSVQSSQNSTVMAFDQFMGCLEMLFGEILSLLRRASGVKHFLNFEGIILLDNKKEGYIVVDDKNAGKGLCQSNEDNAIVSVAEIAHKSISELLRQRKDLHSLLSFEEMTRLWDGCLSFTLQIEKFTCSKVYGLRSTLLAQAKAFVERKHENHMATLVAALDSEKWVQVSVTAERQLLITRLCTGRAAISRSRSNIMSPNKDSSLNHTKATGRRDLVDAEVEGSKYKMVWSCLVLVEMVMTNIACAAHFQTLASNIVSKVTELMRLFNSRTTQLVLGAGALHSSAKLKSINAKHLALVTQSLGMLKSILPHLRAALMAQLPTKQHTLLSDLDKVKKDYNEHTEKCFAKFVSIVGSIVERALAPFLNSTDFDQRAESSSEITCCKFLNGIVTNTKKMYQVLKNLLPRHDLQDIYSKIFSYLDQKVPSLFIAASTVKKNDRNTAKNSNGSLPTSKAFSMPKTFEGKNRMIQEVELMTEQLQFEGLISWKFSLPITLRHHLKLPIPDIAAATGEDEAMSTSEDSDEKVTNLENADEALKGLENEDETIKSGEKANESESAEHENRPIVGNTPAVDKEQHSG